jgi:hypothetical protein
MTTEKTDQTKETEEKGAGMGCCSPQAFSEMMAKCGPKSKCSVIVQEMMKGGCCQPEEK